MSRLSHSLLVRFSTELTVFIAVIWLLAGAVLGSRLQHVFNYGSLPTLPSYLEPFGAPNSVLAALLIPCLIAIGSMVLSKTVSERQESHDRSSSKRDATGSITNRESSFSFAIFWGFSSSLPLWLCMARIILPESIPSPNVWEVIWFAFASSQSAYYLAMRAAVLPSVPDSLNARRFFSLLMLAICMFTTAWWFWQSLTYFQSFRLGFNDFAHFSQRIANTANGRGFLLESPVLPPFWDHFNPGLLLLVPLWKIWPSVHLVFWVQAFSLTAPAWLLYSISLKKGETALRSVLWGSTWLLYPSVSQMNLAYTYGWHPVTMALPFLLLGFRLLMNGKNGSAFVAILVAMSFEEGVIVVVGCFAAAMFVRVWWTKQRTDAFGINLSMKTWGIIWLLCVVLFVLVYSWSGLANFQAGRFAKLGNNLIEVIFSPILRPSDFWGLLFRARNAVFLSILLLPAVASRSLRSIWYWGAVAFPLGVLLVWEHLPAQSIAFQYTACLLPILSLAGIALTPGVISESTANRSTFAWSPSVATLVAGWVLSIYVGQFPWSQSTLDDVLGQTYGLEMDLQRNVGADDNQWITGKIQAMMAESSNREVRVLATGRLAAHCVGVAEIETIGQFWQRRESLSRLEPTLESPLLRYDFILIDFQENFQQTTEESRRVASEAQSLGFALVDQEYNFAIYHRMHESIRGSDQYR